MPNLCTQVSREEFAQIVADSFSFAEVIRKLGYTPRGVHYKVVEKCIKEYGLSFDHFDTQSRSNKQIAFEDLFIENS